VTQMPNPTDIIGVYIIRKHMDADIKDASQ